MNNKTGSLTPAHRYVVLDGLRGVAALAVMLHHFTQHTPHPIFAGAGLAVDLFFCLSGFVIAYSYWDKLRQRMSPFEFVLRRIVRLYPMFVIGVVIGAFSLYYKIAANQTDLPAGQFLPATLLNAFYLPYLGNFHIAIGSDQIPAPIFPTNDPSWSLFFELAVNVLFCVIALRARWQHILFLTALGAAGLAVWALIGGNASPGWGYGNVLGGIPRVLYGFFGGVLVYIIYQRYRARIPRVNPFYIMGVTCVLLMIGSGLAWITSAVCLAPLLVLFGAVSATGSERWNRVFDYLGWLSYPIYCVHFPINSIFSTFTDNRDMGMLPLLVCAPIALAVAHLASRYLEEPVRGWLGRKVLPAPVRP
jgi:peptidoglycan/LPS O-acetylase OafA/YrhL